MMERMSTVLTLTSLILTAYLFNIVSASTSVASYVDVIV